MHDVVSKVALAAAVVSAAATAVVAGPAGADTTSEQRRPGVVAADASAATAVGSRASTQKVLDRLVRETGFPGVLASVRDRDGKVRTYTAGTGNLRTGAPVPRDGRVRIASNTKMFVATVVLQLVAEGELGLDDPVDTHLPGVVRGSGNDGRDITVRDLLQQTSGLPDYDTLVAGSGSLQELAHTYFEPRRLVDAALEQPREFEPGTAWGYSNTNYVLLGMVIERVTGRPVGEVVTHRVIDEIGLRDTYWPHVGEQRIRGAHPRGYWADEPGARWEDITVLDPSLAGAAGQLVSTPADLGRFMQALVSGDLLPPAELAQMQTTVPAPDFDVEPGWRYGLGLAEHELSCGGTAWGHGGDIQGYETRNLVTSDGRWAVVTVTALPTSVEMVADVSAAVDAALCDRDGGASAARPVPSPGAPS